MEQRNPFGAADMARTLAWFYLAGGAVGLLSLLAPMHPSAVVPGLIANCAIAFVAAAFLFALGDRLPRWAVGAFLALGSLAITMAVLWDGHGSSAYSFFYVWVGVEAFYFLSRSQAFVHIAIMAALYGGALAVIDPDPVAMQRWVLTVGVALVAGLLVAAMKERIVRLVDRLSGAARTDALTGIPNRRAFEERFEEELAAARRAGRPLTVAVGDLDGFKLVNDRLGHQAGDDALRRVARELAKWKRRSDVNARVGGEEFALLLPGVDEATRWLGRTGCGSASRRCSPPTTCRSRSRSGSRCSRRRATTPPLSCARPTRRCTPRRRWAATAAWCSPRSWRSRSTAPAPGWPTAQRYSWTP